MNFDIPQEIGAVTRVVENCEHDGRPARKIVATRSYDTAIADVWDALTDATRIPRWFLPVSGDLRLGGRYQLQGNASGTILECEPPARLAITWEYGGEVSWVTVTLRREAKRTELLLEHVAFVDDDRWNQFGPGAVGVGWDMMLLGLDKHLSSGAAIDSNESMAWLGSAEGKTFVQQSSDDWCRASIASGTEAGAATAAAERTRQAYTGETPS